MTSLFASCDKMGKIMQDGCSCWCRFVPKLCYDRIDFILL